jgi:hypothetical protein
MPEPGKYGPHDPATAPRTLEILPVGKWPKPVTVAIPQRLLWQREHLNNLAHKGLSPDRSPTHLAAAAARDEQMARAYADPEWKEQVRRAIWHLATTIGRRHHSPNPTGEFTTDDVWDLLERRGIAAPTEPRAIGPVIAKALRAKAIEDTGRMAKSVRRHSTKITVYRRGATS